MKADLDHVVLAAPDLDAACDEFESATGCRPSEGGPHAGLGTRNALASFGSDRYLEIIAPDPGQPPASNLGSRLAGLPQPELFHWALRADDLETAATTLRASGFEPTPPIETRRTAPDGRLLVWKLMGLPGKGGAWPFFIDWGDCAHPSLDAPHVGSLGELRVSLPEIDAAARLIGGLDGVRIGKGTPALSLSFESERGRIEWRRDLPVGFFG